MSLRYLALSLVVAVVSVPAQEIVAVTTNDFPYERRLADELGVDTPPAVAQGGLFKLWGSGFSPVGVEGDGRAFELGGVRVTIESLDGVERELPLYYVDEAQINAVTPSDAPVGAALLRVAVGGVASEAFAVKVVRTRPRIMEWFDTQSVSGSGARIPIVQVALEDGSRRLVTQAEPAQPGDMLVLWTTGLGPRSEGMDATPGPEELNAPVDVLLGDRVVEVDWAGVSGCCVAAHQVQFRLPEEAPLSCATPLTVRTYGGVYSDMEWLPVNAPGEVCGSIPTPGAPLRSADLRLLRIRTPDGVTDGFTGTFLTGSQWVPSRTSSTVDCSGAVGGVLGGFLDLFDAGSTLRLNTPSGAFDIERQELTFRRHSEQPGVEPFLGPGAYAVSGEGGADVGPFSAMLDVPEPPSFDAESLPEYASPDEPLTVSWDSPVRFLSLRGLTRTAYEEDFARTDGRWFAESFGCSTGDATSLTFPAWALRRMSWPGVGGQVTPTSEVRNEVVLSLIASTETAFDAEGLDQGRFSYTHTEEIAIPYGGPLLPVTPVMTPSGATVLAELAVSAFERERGLTERRLLAEGRGMLIEYPAGTAVALSTAVLPGDLDVIWMDGGGEVLEVASVPVCSEDCAPAAGPQAARWALAVPAGQAARSGALPGETLSW